MQLFVLAGLLTLVSVSLAVGIKLLLLARRTRGFPEAALGFFFLVGGGIGYPLSGAAPFLGEWQALTTTLSALCTGSATAMLYAFTARVFHPGTTAGRLGMAAGLALCLLYFVGYSSTQILAGSPEELLESTMLWGGVSLLMSGGAYAWSGIASLHHYGLHRRRLALGLADPVATNRMLLWGLMGMSTIGIVVVDGVLLYSGSDHAREVVIPLVTCAGGVLVGAILTLAFFPPAPYVARLRRRAAT